ncbi:MerR family DNA-binding transcriptional regulator [Micromonospora sp. DT68]|uniref:MerR family DNA-binding transcriptional regulator n=1 Tax=Micromonospora TaxID=1873 RepID=UPI003CF96C6D
MGALAARTGISVRFLRYYEEQGLLTGLRGPRSACAFVDLLHALWLPSGSTRSPPPGCAP